MNEFDFISQLREKVRTRVPESRVAVGIGDDAAVIRGAADRDAVISTDLLVEGIDFRRESSPPRLLGHKALSVSLSDVAAMGARPVYSLLSIGLPEKVWNSNFKDEFYEGYLVLAERYGVKLAGGDISRSDKSIVIDSIVAGEVRSGAAVLRSTARPGDQIFVTGTLGGAAAGLKLLELGARLSEPPAVAGGPRGTSPTVREGSTQAAGGRQQEAGTEPVDQRSEEDAINSLLLRQLRPDARVGWGLVLGEEQLATAMIDISDGLSSDLAHLCNESGVGALLESTAIPINPNVTQLCGRRALDPLALALHGGEDFELLFTVAPENVARLPKLVDGVSISRVGEITGATGTILVHEKNREWELGPEGFSHFAN